MKKTTIVMVSLLLMSLIFLTSCSNEEEAINETNVSKIETKMEVVDLYANMTEIEIAKEAGLIRDHEKFKEEMRENKEIITVQEISTPVVVDWLHRKKNINPDTVICYGDIDCAGELKCITQCQWVGEGDIKGTVRACRIDEWKNNKGMKFMYPLGFCLQWDHQLS